MTPPAPPPSRAHRGRAVLMMAAPAVGLLAASVLSLGHLLDLPVPCGGRPGCATVAEHPSSRLLGVPIAYLGWMVYAGLLALLARPVLSRQAVVGGALVSAVGTLVSAGLLVYSWRRIGATCPWCVLSGGAMSATLGLTLWRLRERAATFAGPPLSVTFATALGVAVLVGLQAGLMVRGAVAPPVPPERLARVTPTDLIDPAKSLGPAAEAVVTVVVFADFHCRACRRALHSLFNYQQARPEAVRLVFRHLPLWHLRGHETSRAAAALSEMAAEQGRFWEFVHALHAHPQPPKEAGYLALMQTLGFDPTVIARRLETPEDPAVQRVLRDEALAEQLGITATPTFVVLVPGHPPVSATARSLPRWLNSPAVVDALAERQNARTP